MPEEKRGAPRFVARDRIPVHYPEFEPLICDLSEAGAFIEDRRPFRAGQTFRLRIPREEGAIDILAMVRRADPGHGMGVEFLEMSYSSREHLRKLVNHLSRSA